MTDRRNDGRGATWATVALLAVLCIVVAHPAYAYVDPGAGSMVLQLLLGGVAGLLVIFKLWWRSILGFFGRQPAPSMDEVEHTKSSDR